MFDINKKDFGYENEKIIQYVYDNLETDKKRNLELLITNEGKKIILFLKVIFYLKIR
jgi:hypothetical protein